MILMEPSTAPESRNYLIANKRDHDWGLTVTSVGCQKIEPRSLYPHTDHPAEYLFRPDEGRVLHTYQLLYITHGGGWFRSASQPLSPIAEGTAFLLFPGEWHSYAPNRETGWHEYWIGMEGPFMENLIAREFFKKQNPIFPVGLTDDIITLYMKAQRIANEQKPGYQQLLAGIVTLLLGSLLSGIKSAGTGKPGIQQVISKAKVLMIENIETALSPEELAHSVCVSYSWFRRMFKEHTGFSPAQYQQQLRIERAKELLLGTSKSVKEIAFRLQYESPEHFSTLFKKKTGQSPIAFRIGRSLTGPL